MKKQILLLIGLIAVNYVLAQAPQGISHQAVIRDASNELITNSPIGIQVSILQDSAEGEAVYVETHTPVSNANGLITYIIGEGAVESGVFAEIDWSDGPFFLKTEADPTGGTDYSITGVTQFYAVPFALHSLSSDGFPSGTNTGDILFWDGNTWVPIEPGQHRQTLSLCNGIPTWGPCPPSAPAVRIISKNSGQPGYRIIDAQLVDDGDAEVTARGFVWDTVENPTLEQNEGFSQEGAGLGVFTTELSGLTPNTIYFVRSYATNSEGTGYSDQVMINFWDYHSTVTDIDGNIYNTVMIGDQEWMAENLRVTKYRDSSPIPTGLSDAEWASATQGAYAAYNNDEQMSAAYGYLYNWYAVDDARGLCPTGWSAPTIDETIELLDYLISKGFPNEWNTPNTAGNALKSCRKVESPYGGECNTTTHPRWDANETHHGSNEFGFSGIPGGNRNPHEGTFWNIGSYGGWWTSSIHSGTSAWYGDLASFSGFVGRTAFSMRRGISVRCIRDTPDEPSLFNLHLEVQPENSGSVTGAGEYQEGAEVSITATPEEGWAFVNWTGDTEYLDDAEAAAALVTMPADGVSLTANFEEIDSEIIYGDGVTDIDNNEYVTVIIGDQEWMAENLRVTRYNNGDDILTGLSGSEWAGTVTGAYAIYPHGSIDGLNSDEDVLEAYGALYNWYAVNDSRGLCPDGWSAPNNDDWTKLEQSICNALDHSNCENKFPFDDTTTGWKGTNESNALKSCRQVDSPTDGCNTFDHPRWNPDDTNHGFDMLGFSALPSGYRSSNNGVFANVGEYGGWWTSTGHSSENAWHRVMHRNAGTVYRSHFGKSSGFGFRCIRDDVRTNDD